MNFAMPPAGLRPPAATSRSDPAMARWLRPASRDFEVGRPRPAHPQGEGGLSFSFEQVGKTFGPKTVLDALDLHVPAGQFLVVIGKSGCGKSTLLRLLTGL